MLAVGNTYGAIVAVAHASTFPGVLFDQPLFGNSQTVAWLYLAWRGGLAIAYLAATLFEAAGVTAAAPPRRVGYAATAHAIALGLCALASLWAADFAAIAIADDQFSAVNHVVVWVTALLHVLALALVLLKRFF